MMSGSAGTRREAGNALQAQFSPRHTKEFWLLFLGDLESGSEQTGKLFGGSALTPFNFPQCEDRTTHASGQFLLGQIECFATGFEPIAKGACSLQAVHPLWSACQPQKRRHAPVHFTTKGRCLWGL